MFLFSARRRDGPVGGWSGMCPLTGLNIMNIPSPFTLLPHRTFCYRNTQI